MATIQARTGANGETYRVGYYDKSGKFRFTPTMKSRKGAERIAAIIEKQGYEVALNILQVRPASNVPTLREWFQTFLDQRSISASPGTIAGYRREAERTWMPILGEYPLDAITRDIVIDWVAWQVKQPTDRSQKRHAREKAAGIKNPTPLELLSPKTVRSAHHTLSSALEAAVIADKITKNPARGVPLPKDNKEDEKEIFTREEWSRFYSAMDDYYKPFTAFLILSGCRMGEATAVRVGDFNFTSNTVSILQAWKKGESGQVMGTPKSRRSRRTIMIDARAMSEFRELAKGRNKDDLMFLAPRGGRIYGHRFLERQWNKALQDSGITKHLTPHSVRHTFASWQLMAGVSPQIVQSRLGHENLTTTSAVYPHR